MSTESSELAQVVCRTNGCERQNRVTVVHQDTVLPLHCGGCGAVLYCVHENVPVNRREGTLGAPVLVTGTRCTRCGVEDVTRAPAAPVDLSSLPVGVVELLSGM